MEGTLADIVMKSVEDASNAVKGIGSPCFLVGNYTANLYLEKLNEYYTLPEKAKWRRKHCLKQVHKYLLHMASPESLPEDSLSAKLAKGLEYVLDEDLQTKIEMMKKINSAGTKASGICALGFLAGALSSVQFLVAIAVPAGTVGILASLLSRTYLEAYDFASKWDDKIGLDNSRLGKAHNMLKKIHYTELEPVLEECKVEIMRYL